MTVPRTVLGDRLGNGHMGFHVSLPGVNALTADTSDPSKFSLSTDWPYVMQITQTGTMQCGVWVPIPNLGFMPLVIFRPWNGGNSLGYFNRISDVDVSGFQYELADYVGVYENDSGNLYFHVNSNGFASTSQYFYYAVTNLSLDG